MIKLRGGLSHFFKTQCNISPFIWTSSYKILVSRVPNGARQINYLNLSKSLLKCMFRDSIIHTQHFYHQCEHKGCVTNIKLMNLFIADLASQTTHNFLAISSLLNWLPYGILYGGSLRCPVNTLKTQINNLATNHATP